MIFYILKVIRQMIVRICVKIKFYIVYFILKGTVVLHVDLNDPAINPEKNKFNSLQIMNNNPLPQS